MVRPPWETPVTFAFEVQGTPGVVQTRLELGRAKLGWLKALVASPRIWNLTLSQTEKVFDADRLTNSIPGPYMLFLLISPKVPDGAMVNAAGLNHWLSVRLVKVGFPIWLGYQA